MKGTKIINKAGRNLQQLSPTILTFLGVGGVITTSALAVRATPKAHQLKLDVEDYGGDKLDIFLATWKCYIPAALVGTATIACILGANVLNKKQQASIASIYALADQTYQQYRKAAKEVYGEDADNQIKAQVAKDIYISCDGYKVYSPDLDSASEKVLFYDYYSNRYFTSTVAAVINAQYHLNRNWSLKGEVVINDFYEYLGIDKIKGGDVGWADDFVEQGFMWIDFDISKVIMDDGLECFVVSAVHEPEAFYAQCD